MHNSEGIFYSPLENNLSEKIISRCLRDATRTALNTHSMPAACRRQAPAALPPRWEQAARPLRGKPCHPAWKALEAAGFPPETRQAVLTLP